MVRRAPVYVLVEVRGETGFAPRTLPNGRRRLHNIGTMGRFFALSCALAATALAACGGGSSSSEKPWVVVAHDQPSALLSVRAAGANDVWVVGAHDSTGPVLEHYDGTGWTRVASNLAANIDVWWVTSWPDGHVLVGGSQGAIAQSVGGAAFTQLTTPPGNVTVFGLWGAASNDVWAVGGTGAGGAFVWRFDGTTWTAQTIDADIATCWKVNGRAASDVWISCTNGTTLHWDGTALQRMDIPDAQNQQASLFSIGASDKRVITVGGAGTGVLYENDGSGWTSPLGSVGVLLSGVAVSADDDAYAVGAGGTILHGASGAAWQTEPSGTFEDLHAAAIDDTGDVWAVGGRFNQTPRVAGVLLHAGAALKGSFP